MGAEPGAPEPVLEDADVPNPVGSVLDGKYRIDAHIGRGGMASVYRATHLTLRRQVAVKIMHPQFASKEAAAGRFEREAQSASRLRHPNCLQVNDFGMTKDGVKYLVMELLEGNDLSVMLKGPLPAHKAVEIMLQILRGLKHAHENGVIHRDLKPHNIFVTRDHEGHEIFKIVDFGLAKLLATEGTDPAYTQHGAIFGTPLYMSPEQAVGLDDVDARTDLYSAGVIFYHMLAGHPPFQAPRPLSLLHQHVAVPPPPLPGHVPVFVRRVVERLLVKHRDGRYSSAGEVLDALRPRAARPPGPSPREPAVSVPSPSRHHQQGLANALGRVADAPQVTRIDGTESTSHHSSPIVVPIERRPRFSSPNHGSRVELAWTPRASGEVARPPRFSWPSLSPLLAAASLAVLWSLRHTWLETGALTIPLGPGVELRDAHVTLVLWLVVGVLGVWALFRSSR